MAKKAKNNKDIPQKNKVSEISAGERIWLEMQEEERAEREERGREFQKARESAGLSRNAMARLASLSASTLKRYESGKKILRSRLVEKALDNALEIERLQRVFGVLVKQLPTVLQHLNSEKSRFSR